VIKKIFKTPPPLPLWKKKEKKEEERERRWMCHGTRRVRTLMMTISGRS